MLADQSGDVLATVIKCINFAAVKHKYQRRKDPEKTPYINHAIGKKIVEQRVITKYCESKDCSKIKCSLLCYQSCLTFSITRCFKNDVPLLFSFSHEIRY